jgi:hypothetical protein
MSQRYCHTKFLGHYLVKRQERLRCPLSYIRKLPQDLLFSVIVQGINSYYVIDLQYIKKNLLHELSKTQHRENNRKTYRSETFPTELFLATLVSDKKEG